MTTTVTVEAHCDPSTTKVKIQTNDTEGNPQRDVFINDGEDYQAVVYDGRTLTISEIPKE